MFICLENGKDFYLSDIYHVQKMRLLVYVVEVYFLTAPRKRDGSKSSLGSRDVNIRCTYRYFVWKIPNVSKRNSDNEGRDTPLTLILRRIHSLSTLLLGVPESR